MKILHISTVHPRRDTRIFYRECISLSSEGYNVYLLVADGKGDEEIEGINVVDLGAEKSRISNFFRSYFKIQKVVKRLRPNVVHFHDPELMFVGKKISDLGIPVVFDIHENIRSQILDKSYIPKFFRKPIAAIYRNIENVLSKNFHLVLAEHSYENVYEQKGKSLTTILNMPEIGHFEPYANSKRQGNEIFYIGGISNERGLDVTLDALKLLKARGVKFFMHYIGPISDEKRDSLQLTTIADSVKFYGRMDLREGFGISKNCVVGLSVLKPIKNYVESYSTKIFEYMAIGLPVITSDFPLYQNVVEKYACGYCIDPFSPEILADKINHLILNPAIASEMGANGLKMVKVKHNWFSEKQKLIALYKKLSRKEVTNDNPR